ncbi:hypothetical protein [Lentilactobacillus kosonis]|nr:hypothetical protein [Lentilactobacillus kosonis]
MEKRRRKHTKSMNGHPFKIILIGLLIVAIIGGVGVWGYYRNHFKMASINGVDVSGMTISQATQKLNTAADQKHNNVVVKDSEVSINNAEITSLFNKRSSMSMFFKPAMTTKVAISAQESRDD